MPPTAQNSYCSSDLCTAFLKSGNILNFRTLFELMKKNSLSINKEFKMGVEGWE